MGVIYPTKNFLHHVTANCCASDVPVSDRLFVTWVKAGQHQYEAQGQLYHPKTNDFFITNIGEPHEFVPDDEYVEDLDVIDHNPNYLMINSFSRKYISRTLYAIQHPVEKQLDSPEEVPQFVLENHAPYWGGHFELNKMLETIHKLELEMISKPEPVLNLQINIIGQEVLLMVLRGFLTQSPNTYSVPQGIQQEGTKAAKDFLTLSEKQAKPQIGKELQRRIQQSIDYIQQNYNRDITITQLATISCLNPAYYIRSFSYLFGVSPYQFVVQLRLAKALDLLTNTHLEIQEVISEVGFNNPQPFYKAFRKHYGFSPLEVRKRKICC